MKWMTATDKLSWLDIICGGNMRQYSVIDRIILNIDAALSTVVGSQFQSRPNPAEGLETKTLTASDQKKSQGFMRVNHAGEVCAQALYRGQLAFAKEGATRDMLEKAALEETDHLAWTHQRLRELETHRSYLNFFWYMNSFCIGLVASRLGDKWSLGFVEETEAQVFMHLEGHLEAISKDDLRSRAIITKMRDDEAHHGACARHTGAVDLPLIVKRIMSAHAWVMKKIAYYI